MSRSGPAKRGRGYRGHNARDTILRDTCITRGGAAGFPRAPGGEQQRFNRGLLANAELPQQHAHSAMSNPRTDQEADRETRRGGNHSKVDSALKNCC
jgi:hypothetical protein